jgi:hypothetical protein
MGKGIYRSTYSWCRHQLEVNRVFTPRPFYSLGKSPRYPFSRRRGGLKNWFEGENNLVPTATRTPNLRLFRPYSVVIPIAISQINWWGINNLKFGDWYNRLRVTSRVSSKKISNISMTICISIVMKWCDIVLYFLREDFFTFSCRETINCYKI